MKKETVETASIESKKTDLTEDERIEMVLHQLAEIIYESYLNKHPQEHSKSIDLNTGQNNLYKAA